MSIFYFTQNAFVLNGWTKKLYVLAKGATDPASACAQIFDIGEQTGVRLRVFNADTTSPYLDIDPYGINDTVKAYPSSLFSLCLNSENDSEGFLGQGGMSVNLLKTSYDANAKSRLVLGGIGVTYIEATDPINFKLFQFNPDQSIYLFLAPPLSNPDGLTLEGFNMDNLAIYWTPTTME